MNTEWAELVTLLGVVNHNLTQVLELTRRGKAFEAHGAANKAQAALSEAQSICADYAQKQILGAPLPW